MKIQTKYNIGDKMYLVEKHWSSNKPSIKTVFIVGIEIKIITILTTNKNKTLSQLRKSIIYRIGKNKTLDFNTNDYRENYINNPKEYTFITDNKVNAQNKLKELKLEHKNKKIEARSKEIEEITARAKKLKLKIN
jgi:hypothetical protein